MPSPDQGGDPDAPAYAPSQPTASPPSGQLAQPSMSPSAHPQPASSLASPTPSGAPHRPVVSNTTPLITLGEIGLLDVLRQLYGAVVIPPTVLAEY